MSPFFPAAILIIRIVDTIGVILVVDGAKQNVDTNPLLPRLRQSKVVLDRALVLLIFAFPAIPADRCHRAPGTQPDPVFVKSAATAFPCTLRPSSWESL